VTRLAPRSSLAEGPAASDPYSRIAGRGEGGGGEGAGGVGGGGSEEEEEEEEEEGRFSRYFHVAGICDLAGR